MRQDALRQEAARQDLARQQAARQEAARQAAAQRPAPPVREASSQGLAPGAGAAQGQPARPASRPAAAAPRRPTAAPAADPLAELARLIGEQDPFSDFSELQPEPPRGAAVAEAPAAEPRSSLQRQDARLAARRQADLESGRVPAQEAQLRQQARAPAPRQSIERVGQEPAQARAVPQDPAFARAPAPQARRPDAAFDAGEGGEASRRAPPRPAAAPELPRRQASLAAPPQRTALMPPRSEAEPVDRSATSVRLGYGSLAHQAQVQPPPAGPAGRAAPDARQAPVDDDYYDAAPPRPAAAPEARRPQGQAPAQEPAAGYAYSAPRREGADDDYDEYDEAYDPQYGEDGYMPPHGEEVYDGEARRRKGRSALLLVASVLGIIVAGTAGVFAYRMAVHGPSSSASNGPPVIRADTAPSKIVAPPSTTPQDAQQKLIYDRVGGTASGNEKMLPREEQPVDVAAAAMRASPSMATDPVINSLSTEPKRVRTLTVRADGSIAPEAPASNGPSAGVQALQAYAASQMPGAPPTMVNVPGAAAKPATPAVSRSGDFVVQVASQRSEADAMGSWKALQTRYPNLLGSYVASVKKADLGDRGIYYRAQVGPFASKDQANELCQALRGQGGDCMVTKN
ncbi:SPOR domain-containing protein [Xanthobacter sp. V4C-4]|uniref:SPOR domain-containing protein n=1 Tax=Xanthobacter cornucopiae TaxID=3119924 RepID=UPI003726D45C